jgi:hypothetical protein
MTTETLKAPRWETPEQREKRTGKPWPDNWAVYERYEDNDGGRKWYCESYDYAKKNSKKRKRELKYVVCATESGPPPDNWEPELLDKAITMVINCLTEDAKEPQRQPKEAQ